MESLIIIQSFLGIYLIFLRKRLNLGLSLALINIFYHFFFALVYYQFSLNNPADATVYYQESLLSEVSFGLNTQFIIFVVSLFTRLQTSYLSLFFIFSIFGLIGMWLLYQTAYENIKPLNSRKALRLLQITLFFPNLNFWSVAPGKDSLILFAVGLLTYGVSRLRKRVLFVIIGEVLIFVIRPYVALFFLVALVSTLLFSSKSTNLTKTIIKYILALCLIVLLYVIFPMVSSYVGFSDNNINDYIQQRQGYNQGGSSVDISNMNFIFVILTYIYRPLFEFPGGINLYTIAINIDNIILLIFTLYIVLSLYKSRPRKIYLKNINFYFLFNLLLFIVSVIPLALVTSNLGLAIRQKTMIIYAFYSLATLAIASLDVSRGYKKKLAFKYFSKRAYLKNRRSKVLGE